MVITLSEMRTRHAQLKSLRAGQVGVFVGGTSGIGLFALKAFARHMTSPKIYLVGRNETAASTITTEAKQLNPTSEIVFIKADTSLLKNVDEVTKEIQAKEEEINLLFLTASYLSLDPRNETSAVIDRRFALNYYSRMRFIHNLLPELTVASREANSISRVVSVLSAGYEGPIVEEDLELKKNFTFSNCRVHSCVMNDLACEELAKQHPGTAFVHVHPGIVRTGIMDHGGMVMKMVATVAMAICFAMVVSAEESGERNLFHGTATMFRPKVSAGEDAAIGSDGTKGSGAYLLGWNGKNTGNKEILDALRQKHMGETIWKHTVELFARVEQGRRDA